MSKNLFLDLRLLVGLLIAHCLMYFTFDDRSIFWYIFSGTMLFLITFAMFQEAVDDEASFIKYLSIGIISGVLLYFLFWLGYQLIETVYPPIDQSVKRLYRWFGPSVFWEYLALILIAAPGEELFWRGFVQKRLLRYFGVFGSILGGALLYSLVHIYSGAFFLVLAAFVSGLIWGTLYIWKKSMPLIIVSHIVFDLFMFILFPLK
ncbi:CPBP family intramembrane glutamic endopeptidase [Bacillus sp. MRMR6]|uniref:CPBP family intramembrane glutamic endopeptidase n=1 Tax=Bacillus sp. MRMR6 TaxID=1928617 RepID=UPI0009510793|nr:CPBP family intramembrane glutamic endopeptidase [Bacillus sp. MRMR6]OLS41911.1 CAAX protease family protein [Bacillus sp. MRMR6]